MSTQPVLITGAAGFIGARLVEAHQRDGIPVVSVDKPSHFTERAEHAGVEFGVVVDRDAIGAWLDTHGGDVGAVYHLGACTDTTEMDVAYFDRVNVRYSQEIWRWCSRRGVPLVYASSAATYGDGGRGYDDDEARIEELAPLNPYGRSKQEFDLWALARERDCEAPPAWSGFKFFNVYGFGERHKGNMASVVLKASDQIAATGRMKLFRSHHADYRDGEQMRDFVHVDDVVRVLRFAREKPLERGIYNLGTGTARTWLDLVRAVFRELGREPQIDFIDTPEEIRDKYQYFTEANMAKLRAAGYDAPFATLEEGIAKYLARLRR